MPRRAAPRASRPDAVGDAAPTGPVDESQRMPAPNQPRGERRALAPRNIRGWTSAAVLGIVALGIAFHFHLGGDAGVRWLDDLAQLVAAVAAGVSSAFAARASSGRLRLAWCAISVGCSSWAAGQALWCYDELLAHRLTPFPSLCDAGYLVFPVGAVVGLWIMPGVHGRAARRRWLLDSAIIISALAAASWATTLGAVAHSGSDSPFAFAVSLAYPIGDIVVLTMAMAGAGLYRRKVDRSPKLLVSVAMAAMAVSDSAFTYYTATGTYRTGSLCDLGWVASFTLLAMAAASARRMPAPSARQTLASPAMASSTTMLPYIPILLAGSVLVVNRVQGSPFDDVELIGVTAAFVFTLLRQYTTVRENRALVGVVAAREEQLHRQAFYDGLTGLANRALFLDRAAHALLLHSRDRREISVLYCDLDDFKSVNDTLGHGAGDELLVAVSDRLRATLRQGDTVARLGGDEFAILLEDGGRPIPVGTRIVTSLSKPFVIDGRPLTVRASVGVVGVAADEPTPTLDRLLASADIAMYAAKRSGKGRVAAFEEAMTLPNASDLDLLAPLAAAIESREITVAYQPIVHVTTGRLYGFEALARWTHQGVAVPPAEFIPIATRAGVIGQLTDLIIDVASAQVGTWSQLVDDPSMYVSVNVSPTLMTDTEFPDRVEAAISRAGLQPGQLILEITEDAMLADPEAAAAVSRTLLDRGVPLSLDDFGTGYSSLRHVRQLPLQSVKIDRSFLTDIDTDSVSEKFVSAILGMGRTLGLDVIAEGVERPAQQEVLTRLGFSLAQGYLFGRPMPAAEIDAKLWDLVAAGRTEPLEPLARHGRSRSPVSVTRVLPGHTRQRGHTDASAELLSLDRDAARPSADG